MTLPASQVNDDLFDNGLGLSLALLTKAAHGLVKHVFSIVEDPVYFWAEAIIPPYTSPNRS